VARSTEPAKTFQELFTRDELSTFNRGNRFEEFLFFLWCEIETFVIVA